MVYTENAINILTAKTYKGIGRAWIVKNLKGNETHEKIITLLNIELKENNKTNLEEFEYKRTKIKLEIQKLENCIDGIVSIGDENFPKHRGNVKNSEQPIVLFYQGNLNLLNINNKNIAVIGLLIPDSDIEKAERNLVDELVKEGATIISGLALGCDTIAHSQALKSNGNTVAILPSPLNNILPSSNANFAKEIVINKGLLITEYYEDIKSKMELNSRYQERDRLQALFSDYIILSASYAKNNQGNDSGSRLAMEYALNYSIPRAVIYDSNTDENNPKFDLNRQLIKEDRKITIINLENLFSTVKKILNRKSDSQNTQQSQLNFFD